MLLYCQKQQVFLLLNISTLFLFIFLSSLVSALSVSAAASPTKISNLRQEVCANNQNNNMNMNGLVDESCHNDSSSVGTPANNFNKSKTLRLAVIGDIDSNQGLTEQLNIANQYNSQILIIPGDFEYTNGEEVLSNLESHGFTKENTDIVVGSHDSENDVQTWLGNKRTYGEVEFDFTKDKIALFNIDANIKFDCSSTQFKALKSEIDSSQALYRIAVIHQPFVTVKSDHPPNGQFDCYDPLFRAGKIDAVLQAHNHNYQRFNINGLMYGVYGTGTHDTGSSMYPLESNSWEKNDCIKCITGKNGITIMDLQFNRSNSKHLVGWFLGMDQKVLDRFETPVR
ncbi:MAG TPA: metallophosphoesterase [Nitrososphaeraceae archaeon]|nr:metallophosphoesterase [Nitrososphaeraceae archaeon]